MIQRLIHQKTIPSFFGSIICWSCDGEELDREAYVAESLPDGSEMTKSGPAAFRFRLRNKAQNPALNPNLDIDSNPNPSGPMATEQTNIWSFKGTLSKSEGETRVPNLQQCRCRRTTQTMDRRDFS